MMKESKIDFFPLTLSSFVLISHALSRHFFSSEFADPDDGDDVWKRAELDIDLFAGEPFVMIIEVCI